MAFDRCYWLPALKVAVALGTAGLAPAALTTVYYDAATDGDFAVAADGEDGGGVKGREGHLAI